jgi:hypothetical protein
MTGCVCLSYATYSHAKLDIHLYTYIHAYIHESTGERSEIDMMDM